MPTIGLIVNDGKDLAVKTADTIQQRLEASGHSVVRASSAGGRQQVRDLSAISRVTKCRVPFQ